jgi:hypothetical protein
MGNCGRYRAHIVNCYTYTFLIASCKPYYCSNLFLLVWVSNISRSRAVFLSESKLSFLHVIESEMSMENYQVKSN